MSRLPLDPEQLPEALPRGPCRHLHTEKVRNGRAEVREASSRADVGRLSRQARHEERRSFAGVVGRGRGRVATVVPREQQDVVLSEGGAELREPPVERLDTARVAERIVAVAVLGVEVDEVGEDEAGTRAPG